MEERTRFGRFFDRLLNFFMAIGCFIIIFQVISVSIDVAARYFFGISLLWVMPVNEWGLVYLTFLGAAWLQREKGHVGDDSIATMLPRPIALFFRFLGVVLAIASCVVLLGYGSYVTWELFQKNTYDFFKLQWVPLYVVYLVIPFGSALWLIQIIRELYQSIKTKDKQRPIENA